MQIYCVKCKQHQEANDVVNITMKNGRPALQGKCAVCGTKLTKIVSPSSVAA